MSIVASLLVATVCAAPPAPAPPGPWRWPLTPVPVVLRGFQPPALPWGSGHRGVDLAAVPAQPVYAAGAGRVTYAARLAGRGVVAITHDATSALRTSYLPVTPSVRLGSAVTAGTQIGVIEGGADHCAPRLCLHWGLLRGQTYLDPVSLLCRPPVRLLPIWSPPPPLPQKHPAVAAPDSHRTTGMTLTSAGEVGGGAVAGMLLAFALAFLWGQFRHRRRRRLPPDVIDLARERLRRRSRSHPSTSDGSSA